MSNLAFNEDGPVKVSTEDYKIFPNLNLTSVNEAYRYWLNENHNEGLRRLALRNFLRQDDERRRYTALDGYRFDPNEASLYEQLSWRPKLCHEFCAELGYCLANRIQFDQRQLDMMIEIVLKLSVENTQFLCSHHTLAMSIQADGVKKLLDYCPPSSNRPKYFRDDAWGIVTERVAKELRADKLPFETSTEVAPVRFIAKQSPQLGLNAMVEYLKNAYTNLREPRDIVVAEQVASWLDDNLPEDVMFVEHCSEIIDSVIRFQNWSLARKILRRHIVGRKIDRKEYCLHIGGKVQYFLWMYGLVMKTTPNDVEFIRQLDKMIDLF